jgi:hypothetical protein
VIPITVVVFTHSHTRIGNRRSQTLSAIQNKLHVNQADRLKADNKEVRA